MNFKILFAVTIIALCLSPGDSLFIKEKLLLGKLALKSKVAGLLGAKAKVLAVPKLALKGAVAKIGLKPAVAKLGLKGVHIGGIGGIGAVGGLSQIAGIQQIGGVQHIEQDHHSFEFNENPILIPHPEPVVEHIYAPPPPPQVIIPAPPPQVIIQHQEPAPVYTAEISSVPVSVPVEIEQKEDGPSFLASALDSIRETAAAYNPLNLFTSEEKTVPVIESSGDLDYKFVPSYGFSHYKKVNYLPVVPTQVIHAAPQPPIIATIPQTPAYIPQPPAYIPQPPAYIPQPPVHIPEPSLPSVPTGPYAPPPQQTLGPYPPSV